jgi:hypothetical protein
VAVIAGFCAALPLLTGTAEAQPGRQPPAGPLALSVLSMSPSYAERGQTITITGQIKNLAGTTATGLSVQLTASRSQLRTRSDLETFSDGGYPSTLPRLGVPPVLIKSLGSGQSWRFTIRLPVKKLGLSCFGVYPLALQVTDSAFDVARDPVPLPYWPPKATSCTGQRRPQPFPISWVWPMIDTPDQSVCPGLTGNALAARIAPNGRLANLLAVGARYSSRAGLTWAVDPSMLEGVQTMTRSYQLGATVGTTGCKAGAPQPADPNASRWLADLRTATAGQPLFLTPYADVDVAAVIRARNNADLHRAFEAAGQVGHQILGRSPAPAPVPAGPGQFSAIAWPAAGIANGLVLTSLATQHVDSVILTAPVSPLYYTPGAVSTRPTGIGEPLHALLADHQISALLGRHAASTKPGDIFDTSQQYVAETAMIASEVPNIRRPIMIAPPRRWDPSKELATNLLEDTVSAPWLQPSTVGQMITLPAEHVYPPSTQSPSAAELPAKLLRDVSRLDHRIELLQSIRVNPDPRLNRAVFAIESSAWRGKDGKNARALLEQMSDYVKSQLHGVTIRGGGGRSNAYRVTFGGKNAQVPLSIHSDLPYRVKVALHVKADHATVTGIPPFIEVPPRGYAPAVKLKVHVNADHGSIRLSLVAPPKSRLPDHPLPAPAQVILVHPTDFGTLALVLFAAVLALFVIASAARAIKHGRPGPPEQADDLGGSTQPPAPDEHAAPVPTDESVRAPPGADDPVMRDDAPGLPHAERDLPDPVPAGASPGYRRTAGDSGAWVRATERGYDPLVRGRTGRQEAEEHDRAGRGPSRSGWVATPDLHAEEASGSVIRAGGFSNPDNGPEYADSVGNDRSELTSAGPSVGDQEPRRATEERR